MDGQMDRQIIGQIVEWMAYDRCIDGWINGEWSVGWIDVQMDGRGRVDQWIRSMVEFMLNGYIDVEGMDGRYE